MTHGEGGDCPTGAGTGADTCCPRHPLVCRLRNGAVPAGGGDGEPLLGAAKIQEHGGMGAGPILCFRQHGHGCRPGESSMPAGSKPVRPVPPGSGAQSRLLLPAGALDTPEPCSGGQAGGEGWHSGGSGCWWDPGILAPNQEWDTPYPSTHFLGSAQFWCWTEDAHQPWGPMQVQHHWCSVLNHAVMDARAGSWHWHGAVTPECFSSFIFPCKTSSGGW